MLGAKANAFVMLMDFDRHRAHRRILAVAFKRKPMALYLRSLNDDIFKALSSWREGYVEKAWEVKPQFCTAEGTPQQALFGGYLGALADQILSFVSMTVMDDTCQFRTVDLKISFFNKIRVGRLDASGSAKITPTHL